MIYCTKCLMPNTGPYLTFDNEGVCSACRSHEKKKRVLGGIDWNAREREFDKIVLDAKSRNAPFYDVLVPVSGGKDSLTQVHRLLPYGLRILAVSVDYGIKTEVGYHNLSLVPKMGASLITYRPDFPLNRRLTRIGFEDFGIPELLSHAMLHAYPLHVALQFKIPLVLLGENTAFEYSGDPALAGANTMTREWFMKYAASKGRGAQFISGLYRIPMDKLRPYDFPDEIERSDTRTIFMSYYFYWDSEEHLKIAKRYGFRTLDHSMEGTYRNYVGIDEKINRIHEYLKVLKFGYGRATDHACEDIRNGRLTREEAKALVREHDLKELSDYFIDDFIDYIGMNHTDFLSTLERYRNTAIWKRNPAGRWYIPGHLEDDTCEDSGT
ncbi:MAG: N-acetyl sugar amidotransferase [Methanomicrobiales archaeon]|nr:N-acetyl sugar amidotransferase [Methanomicrobiales archaeon]